MNKEKISDVIDRLIELLIYPFIYCIVNKKETVKWIKGYESKEMLSYIKSIENSDKIQLLPINNYDELFDGDIFYINCICDKQTMDKVGPLFNSNNDYNVTKIQDSVDKKLFWLEIFDKKARKDYAILDLKKLIEADEIISFGDNLNDIPMFDVSNSCYVVANGAEKMKEIYPSVISSNEDDGVANWLKNHYQDE